MDLVSRERDLNGIVEEEITDWPDQRRGYLENS